MHACIILISQCISEHAEKDLFFPYEQLELGDDLGSGAFGIVKKAIVHTDGSPVVVAVKMLKGIYI